MGLLQFHEHPQPRKIVQTRDLIVIIYEANYGLRQIFLDGRPLPNNDPQPWWYCYSIGKWVGDELRRGNDRISRSADGSTFGAVHSPMQQS